MDNIEYFKLKIKDIWTLKHIKKPNMKELIKEKKIIWDKENDRRLGIGKGIVEKSIELFYKNKKNNYLYGKRLDDLADICSKLSLPKEYIQLILISRNLVKEKKT